MRNFTGTLAGFLGDRRGATAIEYGLIACGIAAVIAAAIYTVGDEVLTSYYQEIAAGLTGQP